MGFAFFELIQNVMDGYSFEHPVLAQVVWFLLHLEFIINLVLIFGTHTKLFNLSF